MKKEETQKKEMVTLKPMRDAVFEMTPNRMYRSRLFAMIFREKKELLELYNAVNGTHYDDPDLLEINTLENAIYMSMHNDVSFLIDSRLSLYEHQSTYSPNLPLRYLLYVADLYSAMTRNENLYGTKAICIPSPRFIIFYNGEKERPDIEILRLSDAFSAYEEEKSLELTATLININPGHNEELKKVCRTLKDYAEYTARVRTYTKHMPLEQAVERAITECIQEDILADFLAKNRAEAMSMSIYEYDQEKHMRFVRQEGREEDREAINKLIVYLLNDNRLKDLERSTKDRMFQEALLEEYGIEIED